MYKLIILVYAIVFTLSSMFTFHTIEVLYPQLLAFLTVIELIYVLSVFTLIIYHLTITSRVIQ